MRSHLGFTLIELLVVVAIIAILAAILFPIFISAKLRARYASCISNLKQIGQCIQIYRDDHSGGYPLYLVDPGQAWPYGGRPYLERYAKNTKIFICPEDYTKGKIDYDIGWEYFNDPGKPVTSYAYHAGYAQLRTGWLESQLARWQTRFIVAACPWHRHAQAGGPKFNDNYKDLCLRADGSVKQFVWPKYNWSEEPYK